MRPVNCTETAHPEIWMRALACAAALLLPLASSALAAPNEQKAAGPSARYLFLSGSVVGEVETDASLKEVRQGGAVTGATLDVCYGNAAISNRKERFVVELKPSGGKLTGSGRTQVGNEPVSVQITRTVEARKYTFEGTIKIGQTEYEVSSSDNADMSEADFTSARATDEVVVPAPDMLIEPGPGTIGARVKLEALPDFAKALKGESLRVRLESLQPDCQALRSGTLVVQADIDPMRSAAAIEKLRKIPGVVLAGWTAGSYATDFAVRIPSADFGGAKPDRDKLTSAIAASAAKALSATVEATTWDDLTGELTVRIKRPNPSYAGLPLTDKIAITFLVGPEKPGASDALVVWTGTITLRTVDEGPEPSLKFVYVLEGTPGSDTIETAPFVEALVQELKGRVWDSGNSQWKP
jgi:hypothetical protein